MLNSVPISPRKIDEYRLIVGDDMVDELIVKASALKNTKVLNISSTAFGGGVAELLYAKIPLLKNLGIDVGWQVIGGDTSFFTVTKNIHNGLQGMEFLLTDHMKEIYEERNKMNAQALETDADIIVVHDPQPLAMIKYIPESLRKRTKWVWRIHIDLTEPMQEVLDYISEFTPYYDATVITLDRFAKPEMKLNKTYQIPPTIDPLSSKNSFLSREAIKEILERLDIDETKPIMTQVSRFDPWKDPFGVIDTFRLVKKDIPDLQLLMVASMAADDPEGWHYFEKTARYAGLDSSIKLFSNVTGVGNVEVNAIQRISDVVIQKSKREGFGLVVSEAMWKEKPVVGTKVGGIVLQIKNKENGFLIDSTKEAAEKIKFLLQNQDRSREMGKNAHQYVKQNFLTPRSISDWLDIYAENKNGR